MRYIPGLDGLRGVAVLAMVLFHQRDRAEFLGVHGWQPFAWGWTGVDMFFVLSGFLCVSILIEKERGHREALRFWGRRILRTWPIYFIVVGLVAAFMPLDRMPEYGMRVHDGFKPSYLLYLQTLMREAPAPHILSHTWSLVVEEHFYFFLPIAWLALGRRFLPLALVGAVLLSLLARSYYLLRGEVWAAYTMPFARLDGISLGGLLACYHPRLSRQLAALLAWTLVPALMAAEVLSLRYGASRSAAALGPLHGPLLSFLVALGVVGVIRLLLDQRGRLHDLLTTPWLIDVGRVSYGIYLYHRMVHYLGNKLAIRWHGSMSNLALWTLITAGEIVLLVVVVKLSWRYVEQPMLRLKRFL